jgi:anti-anti-sigma factor
MEVTMPWRREYTRDEAALTLSGQKPCATAQTSGPALLHFSTSLLEVTGEAPMLTFEHKMIGEVHILTPQKNLVGGDETNALLTAIDEAAAVGPARVVMDLGRINWVSSLGIGFLRRASLVCDRSGGWLRLARIGKIIESTLFVTGLVIYFESFETVEQAAVAPVNPDHRKVFQKQPEERPKSPGA